MSVDKVRYFSLFSQFSHSFLSFSLFSKADWSGLRDETDLGSLFPGAVEHKLTAPTHTGVAVLLHHSLFHRGTARLSDPSDEHPWRPMFKFVSQSLHAQPRQANRDH